MMAASVLRVEHACVTHESWPDNAGPDPISAPMLPGENVVYEGFVESQAGDGGSRLLQVTTGGPGCPAVLALLVRMKAMEERVSGENASLAARQESLETQNASLAARLAALERKNASLTTEHGSLAARVDELERMEAGTASLAARVDELERNARIAEARNVVFDGTSLVTERIQQGLGAEWAGRSCTSYSDSGIRRTNKHGRERSAQPNERRPRVLRARLSGRSAALRYVPPYL